MKKLTPKERRSVYEGVADLCLNETDIYFCLDYGYFLPTPNPFSNISALEAEALFPEYYLFKPIINHKRGGYFGARSIKDRAYRATALLFAAEMAKDAAE